MQADKNKNTMSKAKLYVLQLDDCPTRRDKTMIAQLEKRTPSQNLQQQNLERIAALSLKSAFKLHLTNTQNFPLTINILSPLRCVQSVLSSNSDLQFQRLIAESLYSSTLLYTTSTSYYKYSFSPRTITHWNALPTCIDLLPTLAQFSQAVCQMVHVSP